MLTVYRSNRAEWLAKLLAEQLRLTPPSIGENVEIIVSTWPTSRWLAEQIALVNGISSQISYPFPGTYLKNLVRSISSNQSIEEDPWQASNLVWPVLDLLPEIINDKNSGPIKEWCIPRLVLGKELDRDLWQLARSISDVFDDYILYRPNLIDEWCNASNNEFLTSVEKLPIETRWQAAFIRLLHKRIPCEPFAIQVKKIIEKLKRGEIKSDQLPKEVHLFGVTSLAPLQVELIQALSGIIDIKIFLLTPCQDLWERCYKRRENLGDQWSTVHDGSWLIKAHRLEANLGRMGAEFQQLLEGSGEYQLGEETEELLFALPVQIAKNKSEEPTLLEQLQERLIKSESLEPLQRKHTDDSLLFIECASKKREVQIIRDQILQWLDKDKTLQPRDILIMTPQIESFAPLIASSFNDIVATDVDLPWCITDRSENKKPGLIQYILKLLEISSSRLTATELDELLANPSIQSQQGLTPEDVNNITNYLQITGFRWGVDGEERNGDEVHSLSWCLDRWLLGLIHPSIPGVAPSGKAPMSKGITPKEIIKWWEVISQIANHIKELRKPKKCSEWINLLNVILKESFNDGGEWLWEYNSILGALDNWRKVVEGYQLKLDCFIVKEVLNEALNKGSSRFGHRSGKITISALEPMRAIPHRIIILMGIDESVFPRRKERASFNLLEQKRFLGDPNSSDQDRYVLLEALMSTRKSLLITWNSRDEKTGERLKACSPVQQWLDHLKDELSTEDLKSLLRQPPANPLDVNNFLSDKGSPAISCDRRNLKAHQLLAKTNKHKTLALAIPLYWSENFSINPKDKISDEQLKDWLLAPQAAWLSKHQLKPKEWEDPLKDSDDLNLNDLQRYTILKERLDKEFSSLKDNPQKDTFDIDLNYWEETTAGTGIMPPKASERLELELLENRWTNLISCLESLGKLKVKELQREKGTTEYLWAGESHITIETGALKSRSVMEGWLKHLEICSKGSSINGTILIARKPKGEFAIALKWKTIPKPLAQKILNQLKNIASQGLEECWPVPPESGWLLAKERRENPIRAEELFRKKWSGGFKIKGECERPEMKLCFGVSSNASLFLSSNEFHKAFSTLYDPIINYLSN